MCVCVCLQGHPVLDATMGSRPGPCTQNILRRGPLRGRRTDGAVRGTRHRRRYNYRRWFVPVYMHACMHAHTHTHSHIHTFAGDAWFLGGTNVLKGHTTRKTNKYAVILGGQVGESCCVFDCLLRVVSVYVPSPPRAPRRRIMTV